MRDYYIRHGAYSDIAVYAIIAGREQDEAAGADH